MAVSMCSSQKQVITSSAYKYAIYSSNTRRDKCRVSISDMSE